MALLNFRKKKEDAQQATARSCSCPTGKTAEISGDCCNEAVKSICCMKVLGAGCKSCHEQYEYVKAAVKAMGLPIEVEYVTDPEKVMAYGVMSMPALVVNEKVVSTGRVLKTADIEKLLHNLGF